MVATAPSNSGTSDLTKTQTVTNPSDNMNKPQQDSDSQQHGPLPSFAKYDLISDLSLIHI